VREEEIFDLGGGNTAVLYIHDEPIVGLARAGIDQGGLLVKTNQVYGSIFNCR